MPTERVWVDWDRVDQKKLDQFLAGKYEIAESNLAEACKTDDDIDADVRQFWANFTSNTGEPLRQGAEQVYRLAGYTLELGVDKRYLKLHARIDPVYTKREPDKIMQLGAQMAEATELKATTSLAEGEDLENAAYCSFQFAPRNEDLVTLYH